MQRYRLYAELSATSFERAKGEIAAFFDAHGDAALTGSAGGLEVLRGSIDEPAWPHRLTICVASDGTGFGLRLSAEFYDPGLEIPQSILDLVSASLPELYVCRHPRRSDEDHAAMVEIFQGRLGGIAAVLDVSAANLPAELQEAGVRAGHVACAAPPIRVNSSVVASDPQSVAASIALRLVERSPVNTRPDWFPKAEALLLGGKADDDLLQEAAELEEQRDAAQFNLDLTVEELEDALVRLTKAENENRYLRRTLRELNEFVYEVPDHEPPGSIAEAIQRARQELAFLEFSSDCDQFDELDRHQKSRSWAIEVWRALLALNGFARAQLEDRPSSDFIRYLDDPPSDEWPIFNSGRVALQESPKTMNDPRCAAARVLPVPINVDESGHVTMVAHIKIATGRTWSPRIHFWDDTKGITMKVHIGHIGNHLPVPNYS